MRLRAGDLFFAPWWNTSSRSLSYFSICLRCWFSRISRRFSSTRISSSPKSVSPFLPFVKILPRMDILFLQRTEHAVGELPRPEPRLLQLALRRVDDVARLVDQADADPEPAARRRPVQRPPEGILHDRRMDGAVRGIQSDLQRREGAHLPRGQGRAGGSRLARPHRERVVPDLVQPLDEFPPDDL